MNLLELWKIKTIFPKDILGILWRYVIDTDCGHVVTKQIAKYNIMQNSIIKYYDEGIYHDSLRTERGIERLIIIHNDKCYIASNCRPLITHNKVRNLMYAYTKNRKSKGWRYIEYYIDLPNLNKQKL